LDRPTQSSPGRICVCGDSPLDGDATIRLPAHGDRRGLPTHCQCARRTLDKTRRSDELLEWAAHRQAGRPTGFPSKGLQRTGRAKNALRHLTSGSFWYL